MPRYALPLDQWRGNAELAKFLNNGIDVIQKNNTYLVFSIDKGGVHAPGVLEEDDLYDEDGHALDSELNFL